MNESIRQLQLVLDERSAAEPEHERTLREAMATASFAGEVLAAWGEQELHRGRRACYGLAKEHMLYARSVYAWSTYEADVARWLHMPDHRRVLALSESGSTAALTEPEVAMLAGRPEAPGQVRAPHTLFRPPHWPDRPDAVGAIGDFFAALDAAAKKPPP